MDVKSMVELGIIQPGDRVYARQHTDYPWGWGVVTLAYIEESPKPLWFDGAHIFAKWEHAAGRTEPYGVGIYRITEWEINPERLK